MTEEKNAFALAVLSDIYNALNQSLTKDDVLLLHRMFRRLNQSHQEADEPEALIGLKVARDLVGDWLDHHDPDPDVHQPLQLPRHDTL